jgi:hypothetical protein
MFPGRNSKVHMTGFSLGINLKEFKKTNVVPGEHFSEFIFNIYIFFIEAM